MKIYAMKAMVNPFADVAKSAWEFILNELPEGTIVTPDSLMQAYDASPIADGIKRGHPNANRKSIDRVIIKLVDRGILRKEEDEEKAWFVRTGAKEIRDGEFVKGIIIRNGEAIFEHQIEYMISHGEAKDREEAIAFLQKSKS